MALCQKLSLVPYIICEQTAKTLARLNGCTGLPESLLVPLVINTPFIWAGSYDGNS